MKHHYCPACKKPRAVHWRRGNQRFVCDYCGKLYQNRNAARAMNWRWKIPDDAVKSITSQLRDAGFTESMINSLLDQPLPFTEQEFCAMEACGVTLTEIRDAFHDAELFGLVTRTENTI